MTDSHDPFAANPYTPPSRRDDEPRDDAAETATPQPPVSNDAPPAPAPEPTTPTYTPSPAPAADVEPTVEVPAAAPPAAAPPADDFTHRFPAAGDAAAAAAPVTAAPLYSQGDPFRENQSIFASSDAGQGGAGGGVVAPPKRRRGRTLVGALALLVLAGGAGFGGAALQDELQDDGGSSGNVVSSLDNGNNAKQTSLPAGTVEQVAEKVLPSVVQINVKGGEESGSGTGIIISSDGDILTNNHVVDVAGDSGTITVAFNDGTNTTAEIVGVDPKTDLAVIKAAGKTGLTAATLGTSADLKVGQEVVAIGSPFGLESTVTQGIVSALNRPVSSSDGSGTAAPTTFPAVQTDAAINPGNSGGPLVDLQGNVIAINSAIRSGTTTSGDAGSIGLGFAIPIDLAKNVSKQLLAGKQVEHAQIGVSVDNFLGTDGITGIGAQIKEITPNGAGDDAGLKEGDVITAVNGALIPTSEALVAAVRGFNPGEKVTLTYTRGGEKAEVDVTLKSDGGTTE
ncbi:MAG: trypsin-like peptidase domain-containing protein [Aeromicrobium sp.]